MTQEDIKVLSEQIKLLRFQRKKSQEECAKALNISIPTYKNFEDNPNKLNLEQAINLSTFLDYNLLQFFLENILQNAMCIKDLKEK